MTTVEARDVVVEMRRRRVLDGCSLLAGPGITVVAGANGAGKSTLLRTIVGLTPVRSGSVSIDGRLVGDRRSRRSIGDLVGYVPQDPGLDPRLTVADALSYARWLHGLPDEPLPPAAAHLLSVVGLDARRDERLGALSGGMHRLAMVAVALAHDPSVLVLDEVTAGVDVDRRGALRSHLDGLRSTSTVLLASHVVGDLEHLADRVVVLRSGNVAFDGSPAALVELGAGADPTESALEAGLRRIATA